MADERLGASFTIDINDLKAGLNTANKLIRESQSEFKAAAAGLDKYTEAEKIAEARIKSLNQIIPVQQEKVKKLKEQYAKLVKEGLDETSNRAIELRTQINREEAALNSNEAELKQQTAALEELQNASEDAGDEIEKTGKQAEKTSGSFTVMKGALANLVADGFRAAISAAKDFTKQLVNVGTTFDDSMAQVAAVSGASADELEKLRDKAKEMGSTTKFTASEAADAFNYMAMAGWKTEDMLSGIEGILNLAAASGSDLATTSDIVTDALTAMGYEAKDAGRLADVMAAASSNANTNVEMMGQTFQYAAPIVGALGYSMEDTAVAIGLMANAGIKGEKSGTALRSILTRLSAPPKECADAMSTLGLKITKTDGTMKSLDEIMVDLRKSFSKLSETEQTAIAKSIAGQEAMSGLLAIVNAAPADFDKLTKAVEASNGAADKMATTMVDTLGGDMTILKSQIEGVQLTIFEKLEPTLRSGVKEIQNFIGTVDWQDFGKRAGKAIATLSESAKKFAKNSLPMLKKALVLVGKALNFVIENFHILAPAVYTAVTAITAFKAAMAVTAAITAAKAAIAGLTTGISLAAKAQTVWNAAMAANPIGAIITAVALLAAGIAYLVTQNKQAAESVDILTESQRKAVDTIKDVADAFKEQKKAADQTVAAYVANSDYITRTLLPDLERLVGANGEVQESDKARVDFIMNQLREAYDNEHLQLSDIIDDYGKVREEVYKTIEAKKAQFMLEAYEEQYKNALANTADAQNRQAIEARGLAKEEKWLELAKIDLTNAQNAYNDAVENGGLIQQLVAKSALNDAKEALAERQKAYNEQKTIYDTAATDAQLYYDTINAYQSASTAILQGETEKAIDILSSYGSGFQTAASVQKKSIEEQQKILGDQVINTEIAYQTLVNDHKAAWDKMSEEEKKAALEAQKEAKKRADDAKTEFKKVGGNITEGIAEGAEGSSWILDKTMKQIIDKAVSAAKKAADSHSPSRRFRKEVGRMLGLGTALGVEDSTQQVVKSVKNQINAIRAAYDIDGFAPSINAGVTAKSIAGNTVAGNENRTVVVNQYNTYSQAHSRYEIYKSKQQTAAAVRLALGTV